MKRNVLLKQIRELARSRGVVLVLREASKHTVVTFGTKTTTVPRHSEINEITARSILKYLKEEN